MLPEEQGALWLPIQKVMPLHISKLGRLSTMLVENKRVVQDMAQVFGGRSAKPEGIITIPSADGTSPIMVAGLGVTEAAELEDLALEAIERDAEQVKKTGTAIDFAAERERRGAPTAESFDTRFREYLHERAEWGKRNIRTALTTPYGEHIRENKGMGKGQGMSVVPANYKKESD